MVDKIAEFRSLAYMPVLQPVILAAEQERDQWVIALGALSDVEFKEFLAPMIADGEAKLRNLPAWSRLPIQARLLGRVRITPEIAALAVEMLMRDQDWSPEADKLLSSDNSLCLCSYADGAWIADTHGEVNMNQWTKLKFVSPRI